jgi:hypothetical protein
MILTFTLRNQKKGWGCASSGRASVRPWVQCQYHKRRKKPEKEKQLNSKQEKGRIEGRSDK